MASTLVARNGGRAGIATLAAILLLGLGLRASYAWQGRDPVFDAAAYERIATNLEHGRGFTVGRTATQPASDYSPGLPLLVAGLYELSGGVHVRLARLALALLGSLSVLFAYLIGRRLSGPGAGLIAAGAVAVYPALLEYQGMLMGEPLAATLLSAAVLSMLWASDSMPSGSAVGGAVGEGDRRRETADVPALNEGSPALRWPVPGMLLGALALVRPEYLAIALLLAVIAFVVRPGRRVNGAVPSPFGPSAVGLRHAALLLIGVLAVVGPWTLRNAIALDRFVPVSTGGGQVLFAATYMPSGGDPERVGREVLERHPGLTRALASRYLRPGAPTSVDAVLARVRLEQILAALAAQRYPGTEADVALARMGRERLWRDVSERPLGYTGFLAAKLVRIWWHGPRDVMHRPLWAALHWALVALALLGLGTLAWRRRWEAVVLGTVLLSATAIGVLLVASPRRVLVTIPLVAALAGVGATACRDSLARWYR